MSKNMPSLDRQLDNHCIVVGALWTVSLQIGSTQNHSSSLPSSGVDTSATESVGINETRSYPRIALCVTIVQLYKNVPRKKITAETG